MKIYSKKECGSIMEDITLWVIIFATIITTGVGLLNISICWIAQKNIGNCCWLVLLSQQSLS